MRGHSGDITDLSWSNDEKYLASGSVDNTIILWALDKQTPLLRFEQHKNYVNGVSIDPFFNYIIS